MNSPKSNKNRFSIVDQFTDQTVVQIHDNEIDLLTRTPVASTITGRVERFNIDDKYKINGGAGAGGVGIDSAFLPDAVKIKDEKTKDEKTLFDLISKDDENNSSNLNYYQSHDSTVQGQPVRLNSSIGNDYQSTMDFLQDEDIQEAYNDCIYYDSTMFDRYIDARKYTMQTKVINYFLEYVKFFVDKFKKDKSILRKYNKDYIKKNIQEDLSDYRISQKDPTNRSRALSYSMGITGSDDVNNGNCSCTCKMTYNARDDIYTFTTTYYSDKELYDANKSS